jgi:hypothetical protein
MDNMDRSTFSMLYHSCSAVANCTFSLRLHPFGSQLQDFDFGKEKPFPLRDQHFFTSIDKVPGV